MGGSVGPGPTRPTVLWITDEPPDRSLGGGNIRQAHLLGGLTEVADVTLLLVGELKDAAVRSSLATLIEVGSGEPRVWRSQTARRIQDLWIAVRGPREVVTTARRRRLLRPHLTSCLPRAQVVVATHLGMAALLPKRPSGRWVAQIHHVSSAQAEQEHAITNGRRQRWLLRRLAGQARRFEDRMVREFDLVTVVSNEDAALLGLTPGPRSLVVPNGVDTDHYAPTPLPPEPSIVMTGSFQYQPNVDGAVWFVDHVLPLIQRAVPEATLTLVGREPLPEVIALADRPGVALHSDVPDMAPWLAAARVTVVPLRIGTGTRLKALESMAAGRPTVGTSLGLEGIDLIPGVHAEVADGAPAMASAVARVLTDDDHARALAAAGRTLVEERYRWSDIGARFAARLLELG